MLKTDAQLFGGFSMQGPTEESQIITELKKQYDVVEVDPAKPITKKFDVLLAVQPSSLTPEAMENFVAVREVGPADRDLRRSVAAGSTRSAASSAPASRSSRPAA